MALSIADILTVVYPTILRDMDSRYSVIEPVRLEPNGYVAYMQDNPSGLRVPMVWSQRDDNENNERNRINIVRGLITNAVHALDMMREEAGFTDPEVEYEDVIHDDTT